MNKDTIYREDAIKAINLKARIPHDIASAQYAQMAINAICSVPSADRPQGEWICHEGGWIDFDYYPTKYECNQCHHYVDVASDKKFCPNCGADMRGERDE